MNANVPPTERKSVYEDLRPLLFSIAYRMVSSASDAEDIVQEAFLRFHRESGKGADIESPKHGCPRSPPDWPSITSSRRACAERAMSAPGCPSLS
jgi:hypothetical protein